VRMPRVVKAVNTLSVRMREEEVEEEVVRDWTSRNARDDRRNADAIATVVVDAIVVPRACLSEETAVSKANPRRRNERDCRDESDSAEQDAEKSRDTEGSRSMEASFSEGPASSPGNRNDEAETMPTKPRRRAACCADETAVAVVVVVVGKAAPRQSAVLLPRIPEAAVAAAVALSTSFSLCDKSGFP